MQNNVQINQSVEKALRIIEILAHSSGSMRLFDIAQQANMPTSTAFRMVNTLVKKGYAFQERDGSQRYGLTLRFLNIGQLISNHFQIRDITHSFLTALVQETGESCCLALNENGQLRYLDVVEGMRNQVVIRQRIGGTAPMHCTGSGKIFLSQFDDDKLSAFIREKGLPSVTRNTITREEDLKVELEAVRTRGYAIDDEECQIGMRCLSVPIRNANGTIVAAISLSGPIARMTHLRCQQEISVKLCECASQIAQQIYGNIP